jgi:hypothetical protein
MVCGTLFQPMLLPKPTLFLQIKFVICAAEIILPLFASFRGWHIYIFIFPRLKGTVMGLPFAGF